MPTRVRDHRRRTLAEVLAIVRWGYGHVAAMSLIEFTTDAQHALEDYRRRHCADQPIPHRAAPATGL